MPVAASLGSSALAGWALTCAACAMCVRCHWSPRQLRQEMEASKEATQKLVEDMRVRGARGGWVGGRVGGQRRRGAMEERGRGHRGKGGSEGRGDG